jgi:serine/threonine protein kinase
MRPQHKCIKVVLILDIAEGMRYIHRMHMAHRDLKPSNVLVNLEDPGKKSSRAYSVKIADFGLTKTKEASRTYKDQTTNLGTSRYMAPEMMASGNEKGEFNPTKADVFSFGIMCCEILTGESAYGEIKNWGAFKKEVKENGDFRPDLQQGEGPLRLESLIERCWAHNHRSRPDFDIICPELRYIKGLLLRGAFLMCCIFLNITHSHTNLMLQYLLAINMQL